MPFLPFARRSSKVPRSRNNTVSGGALIALALAVLILPLRWLMAGAAAAAFHEGCHWAAIRLCGGKAVRLHIGGRGMRMAVEELSPGKELICALAGPVGSLLLLLTARLFPAVAVCAALQSAYNLLPIYPLDGGRALRCAVRLFLPVKMADKVSVWTERLCLAAILAGAAYAVIWLRLGLMPLLLAAMIFAKKNSLQTAGNKSTIDLPF